jgi:hypothetical protein
LREYEEFEKSWHGEKGEKKQGLIAKPLLFLRFVKTASTLFQDRWFQPLTHPSEKLRQ